MKALLDVVGQFAGLIKKNASPDSQPVVGILLQLLFDIVVRMALAAAWKRIAILEPVR